MKTELANYTVLREQWLVKRTEERQAEADKVTASERRDTRISCGVQSASVKMENGTFFIRVDGFPVYCNIDHYRYIIRVLDTLLFGDDRVEFPTSTLVEIGSGSMKTEFGSEVVLMPNDLSVFARAVTNSTEFANEKLGISVSRLSRLEDDAWSEYRIDSYRIDSDELHFSMSMTAKEAWFLYTVLRLVVREVEKYIEEV